MASDIDICNLALLRLGTRSSISALTEGSTEANACALAYPIVRDTLLAQHRWSFATRRVALADLGNPPDNWAFRYAYPPDCLHARALHPPAPPQPTGGPPAVDATSLPFEVSADCDASGNPIRIVLADQPGAELVYTARITTAAQFDAGFVEALSWTLAAELAITLTGDKIIAQYCLQTAAAAVAGAKANDANESPFVDDRPAEWIAAYRIFRRPTWPNR